MIGPHSAHAAEAQSAAVLAAAADDSAVSEVVVTARHRSEDSQRVPIALSVIGGAQLAKTDTNNISQIAQLVPSLQFTFFNARNANINIRGLGNNIGLANDGLEPGVGFYVDQVYYARPAAATFDLEDIDRIETLRGPQGTLFGKNTTAGALAVTTQAPSFTPEASGEVTGGNYGLFQTKLTLSGPLIDDKLAARLSVSSETKNGFVTNVYANNVVNSEQTLSLRGQILYTPTADFKLRVIADYSKQNSNCCDLVLANIVSPPNGKNFLTYTGAFGYTPVVNPFGRQADTNAKIQADQETGGISVDAEWDLHKFILSSITAYRFWNWWPANDSDYTPLSVLNVAQNGDYQNQISQELRIASKGENKIDYVAGLYVFREQIAAVAETQYGSAASYFLLSPALPAAVLNGYTENSWGSYDTNSYAAFGQAVWHATDRLSITGGLRYTYDAKYGNFDQIVSGGVPLTGALAKLAAYRAALGAADAFNVTADKGDLSGQVNIAYQATSNLLAYVNYARGYKSGGLNLTQLPKGASSVIAPESVDSVEGGVKTRLFQRRLTFNADLFWQRDQNYQANIYDPTLSKQYLANVPEVDSEGVEFDAQAQPTDNLSLYASGTYDDATYTKYPGAPCGLENANLTHCNLDGEPLAGVARWAGSAGGEYHRAVPLASGEVEAFIGADYSYRSSLYSAATDSIYTRLPSLNLVNGRIGVRAANHRWDLTVWAKNLLDAQYFNFLSPGVGNTGALFAQPGDPRTFGATLKLHY